IPLAKKYYTQEETLVYDNFKRATYKESAAYIISDLDTAMALLPNAYTGTDVNLGTTHIGRANRLAAAVLKARVYLYAASPANQDDNITKINGMGDFSVLNETAYRDQWELAALKMDTIIQMANFGVFNAMLSTHLADATNATPADFVFRKFFNTNALENQHFPPFYYGNANTIPAHNLVKAFNTKSGFPQNDPRSGWSMSAPYSNLDNRFLMNIYHHGRVFGTTGGAINVVKGGKDSPEFDQRASRSGYYLAKFISTKNALLNPTLKSNAIHYHPLLRRSEVFLNFAEASNEAWGPKVKGPGCKYSAYDIMKDVRSKSGGITSTTYLDEMALTKDDFRKLIQNERRIEFAFENHRYFDLRRCLLPLNEDVYGIEVTIENSVPVYTERKLEARSYEVKHYFSPLPYNELIKNDNLINNQGWE
ncbi:MAG: RagB/SusD family nutrient uptake outer membrane protein, partial [Paludibacter sp.]|nr:RagB/SusD family nutrient uptake outer membrane protein [Paludibacter sp.]